MSGANSSGADQLLESIGRSLERAGTAMDRLFRGEPIWEAPGPAAEPAAEPPPPSKADGCPYKGLRPYTDSEEDRFYFVGREEDSETIAANLLTAPLTLLYGASGVGKSSVLMAGAVPFLRQQRDVAVVIFRDWQDPAAFARLKATIAEAAGLPAPGDDAPLDDLLAEVTRHRRGSFAVIFDQFEEYFLYNPESKTGRRYDAEIARAVNRTEVRARFLLSMREDALSSLDRFKGRIPDLFGNYLRLDHLNLEAAERAIREPLERYNGRHGTSITPDDDLVELLLEDVQTGKVTIGQVGQGRAAVVGEPDEASRARIETPFLQMVLTRLWDAEMAAGSSKLRLDTYKGMGRAKKIVETHLDKIMAGLVPGERAVCALFFDRLVTPSGTKVACGLDDFERWAGGRSAAVAAVLSKLSRASILRTVASAPDRPGVPRYEIFHDMLAVPILDWQQRFTAENEERGRLRRFGLIAGFLALLAVGLAYGAYERNRSREAEDRRTRDLLHERAQTKLKADQAKELEKKSLEIQKQADLARASLLVAQAELTKSQSGNQLQRSVLLGVEALRVSPTPEARQIVLNALTLLPRPVTPRLEHTREVQGIAFSDDGALLASGGLDGRARVWDARGGKGGAPRAEFNHGGPIGRLAFGKAGHLLATVSAAQAAADEAAPAAYPPAPPAAPPPAAAPFAPAQEDIVPLCTPPEEARDGAPPVAATSDAPKRVPANLGGVALVWSLDRPDDPPVRIDHGSTIERATFSPDGRRLATVGRDGSTRLWNLDDQTETEAAGASGAIQVLSPDWARLARLDPDGKATLIPLEPGREAIPLDHKGPIGSVRFTQDGRLLLAESKGLGPPTRNSGEPSVSIFQASDGRLRRSLSLAAPLLGAGVDRGGRHLLLLSQQGSQWLDLEAPENRPPLAYNLYLTSAAFAAGGRYAAASSGDIAYVFDVETGQFLNSIQHGAVEIGVAFSADGRRLVTRDRSGAGGPGGVIQLVPMAAPPLPGQPIFAQGAGGGPDAEESATSDWRNVARVWETLTGREVARMHHEGPLTDAAFSPDGDRLATASRDRTARVWEATALREVRLEPLGGAPFAAAFSPGGDRLAILDRDDEPARAVSRRGGPPAGDPTARVRRVSLAAPAGMVLPRHSVVRIYDATDGREQGRPFRPRLSLQSLSFSPDGHFLAAIAGQPMTVFAAPVVLGDPGFPAPPHYMSMPRPVAGAGATAFESSVQLWNLTNERRLHRIPADGQVFAAAPGPGAGLIAVAETRGVLNLLDPDGRRPARRIEYSGPAGTGFVFNQEGTHLATTDWDGRLRVWGVADGREVGPGITPPSQAASAALSPGGATLATSDAEGNLRLWDVAKGRELAEARADGRRLIRPASRRALAPVVNFGPSLAFSPDGQALVSFSQGANKVTLVPDVKAKGRATSLQLDSPVVSVAFKGGDTLIVRRSDGLAEVRRIGEEPGSPRVVGEPGASAVALSPDRTLYAQAGQDRVAVFALGTGDSVASGALKSPAVAAIFDHEGKRLAVSCADGTAHVFAREEKALRPIAQARCDTPPYVLAFAPADRSLLMMTWGRAWRMDLSADEPKATPLGPEDANVSRTVSPDGRFLVTRDNEGTVRLFGPGDEPGGPRLRIAPLYFPTFSPDGKTLVLPGDAGAVRLVRRGEGEQKTVPVEGRPTAAAFSPDGGLLGVAAGQGRALIYELATKKTIPVGLPGAAWGLAFSPKGTYLAASDQAGGVTVWSARERRTLPGLKLDNPAALLAFNRDESSLAAGSWDGTIRVWSLADPSRVRQETHFSGGDPPLAIAFRPDGDSIAMAQRSGVVRDLPLWTDKQLIDQAEARLTRGFTQAEKGRYLRDRGDPASPGAGGGSAAVPPTPSGTARPRGG